MEEVSNEERAKLEAQNKALIDETRDKLESDLQADKDELEKQFAYRREQMRQELADEHEKV